MSIDFEKPNNVGNIRIYAKDFEATPEMIEAKGYFINAVKSGYRPQKQ